MTKKYDDAGTSNDETVIHAVKQNTFKIATPVLDFTVLSCKCISTWPVTFFLGTTSQGIKCCTGNNSSGLSHTNRLRNFDVHRKILKTEMTIIGRDFFTITTKFIRVKLKERVF